MAYMRWIEPYNFNIYWHAGAVKHMSYEKCTVLDPDGKTVDFYYSDIKSKRVDVTQKINTTFKHIDKENWKKIRESLDRFIADVEEKWVK